MSSINDDIEQTLYKLSVLLEYSNLPAAEQTLALINQAKLLWQEQQTEEQE
jgi:hypothetical protein